ncbi:hypothetical protein TWF718_005794 [Orbilia javanica]|uniref:Uncharacterized protein n=1 Tax=Orbilia javanica TaxID=47235 RepID=A0AAN8MSF7_9PEZI
MQIYTGHGRKSTAINSPRHLTLRHARRRKVLERQALEQAKPLRLAAEGTPHADQAGDGDSQAGSKTGSKKNSKAGSQPGTGDTSGETETSLQPGEEMYYSFWKPGLEAGGNYHINVTQLVSVPDGADELKLTAEQGFKVQAPQFALPGGSVHSFYPPGGHSDHHRILPHIVLTDPHLPWERYGTQDKDLNADTRNRVPWMALFTFTQKELQLPDQSVFKDTSDKLGKPVKQTPTLAVSMAVSDLLALPAADVTTPVSFLPDLSEEDKATRGDFIFVTADLFTSFFSDFDDKGNRNIPSSGHPDTSMYKYMSHVREVNTSGMAISGVEDVGIFSVVVSSRSGPPDNKADVLVHVHLVSIEGVEEMTLPITTDYVALCSLHSWSYTVQHPGTLTVGDLFVNLGATTGVLRPSQEIIKPLRANDKSKVSQRIADRLEDGYSLVKWRVPTGEQTVALYRGPFTPTFVPYPLSNLTACSNSGQDLQVLDREVGIMDITYASAWQLGRTLALGDQVFSAALGRHRLALSKEAMKQCKIEAVREISGKDHSYRSRVDVLKDISHTVDKLTNINPRPSSVADGSTEGLHSGEPPLPPPLESGILHSRISHPGKRWHRPRLQSHHIPALGFGAPLIRKRYEEHTAKVAFKLAKSKDGGTYDSTNDPVSTDWMVIIEWVMDRMFLAGIPAHYFIPDPTYLEQERLHFFSIDRNWIDSLIDGALSLASHRLDDSDRVAIKKSINHYIETNKPQLPTYGFLLRSELVAKFPDLRVTTVPEPPDGAPLLRHEIIDDDVMLGLFDRVPGARDADGMPELTHLVFTQPPHQQRFAVGETLEGHSLSVDILRQYTCSEEERSKDPQRHTAIKTITDAPGKDDHIFLWSSKPSGTDSSLHILRLPHFPERQLKILEGKMDKRYFDDDKANAALFARQLTDPRFKLTVPFDQHSISSSSSSDVPKTLKSLRVATTRPQLTRAIDHSVDRGRARDKGRTNMGRGDDCATSVYNRHPGYRPSRKSLSNNLGPHVPRVSIGLPDHLIEVGRKVKAKHAEKIRRSRVATPTMPAAQASGIMQTSVTSASPDRSPPAGPPYFKIDVYSFSAGTVITGDCLPQDLIFSIPVLNTKNSQYKLVEYDIWIPLGRATSNPATLMETYDGPGPYMLTNQRFNVLTTNYEDPDDREKFLLLRLVPRSADGWIRIEKVDEIGFVLCLAQVNEFAARNVVISEIQTSAFYKDLPWSPLQDEFDIRVVNTSK